MKKFLILSTMLVFFLANINAQSIMTQTGTNGAAKTTHTDADTSYHKSDLAGQTLNFNLITIALAGTKTSGTVGGTAVPFGSLDGSRWFQLYDKDSVSSQNLSNGDNNLVWRFNQTWWRYYRIRIYSTGTEVATYVCRLLGRKNPN